MRAFGGGQSREVTRGRTGRRTLRPPAFPSRGTAGVELVTSPRNTLPVALFVSLIPWLSCWRWGRVSTPIVAGEPFRAYPASTIRQIANLSSESADPAKRHEQVRREQGTLAAGNASQKGKPWQSAAGPRK